MSDSLPGGAARELHRLHRGGTEQPALRPLPAEPFDPTVALQAKADRKARISVRGSRYSVPDAYAGRTVDVRLGGGTVTGGRPCCSLGL